MKLVLISPKGPLYRHKGGIFKKSLRYQPLTLTTLAALIPDDLDIDIEVELYDEGIQDIPEKLDADIIALTVITGTSVRSYELAKQFQERGITVILGGPHVTLMPDEAQQHADSICVGYAEESWPQLLRDYIKGDLKKRYTQSPDMSLEDMPFPKRELFNKKYFLTQAVFEATRSCMHSCEFCTAPAAWGRKHYQKPIDWVIEDIKRVGQKKIIFIDLNLIADVDYAKELFTRLIPLKVNWFGLSTVLIAHDKELMTLLSKSGCKGLLLGLETISEESLKDTKKRFNSSVSYKDVIGELHEYGVSIQGCFVFGLDHDMPDVFDATVDFAIDAGIDLPRFSVLTPFPGTPLHSRLLNEGRIITQNWELYDGQHVVYQPKNMTVDELIKGHERAWKQVYSWSAIAKRLWNAKNFQPLAFSTNLGYRFYAYHLNNYYNCDWQTNTLFPAVTPLIDIPSKSISLSRNNKEKKIVCG